MLFEKQSEKKFMIGFDLRDDFCQMSYCLLQMNGMPQEPVTYAAMPGEDRFDIPAVLSKPLGVNRWYHGREAMARSSDPASIYIPHLVSQALEGESMVIEDKTYEFTALLAIYINRCLGELSGIMPPSGTAVIMFTARNMDSRMIRMLEDVRARLDLKSDVYYQSYAGSYYDFMLNQTKELREPASALLEYDTGGKVRVRKLIFNPHTRPIVAYEEESEYPGLFAPDDGGKDAEFTRIIHKELVGHNFSSVYLIGSGFKGNWMKKSATAICRGRRAFQGANLFSKGAAYGAMFKTMNPGILSEYFFLDNNKLRTNVLIRAYSHGKAQTISLLDAGINWYEVHKNADLILDSTAELDLVLKPLTGGKEEPYHIRLEGLPVREGRITRIHMEFTMPSPEKIHIFMEDLGFGEIFPSSGMKWEQEITAS